MGVRAGAAASGLAVLALAAAASPLCVASAAAAAPGAITEFTAGLSSGAASIAPGADGNLWFTVEGATKAIGRITPSGSITEFTAGLNPESKPRSITGGPEGALWFTDEGKTPAIGRITPSGSITEFSSGLNPESKPLKITLGPDGNLWFTDSGGTPAIGRITPSGSITEFSTGLNEGAEPRAIAPGADGNLWFTDSSKTPAIGRITPSGAVTEFSEGLGKSSVPWGIAPGPDGNVWFTGLGTPTIGRITPSGAITEFEEGLNKGASPGGIAPGADGNLWFTDLNTPAIGRITPSGAITEFSAGLDANSKPVNIAPGPDGNVWFAAEGATPAIGQVGTGAPAGLVSPPTVTGNDQAGSAQRCEGAAWSTWAYIVQPSASLYSFDGYRWLLNGSEVATGQSYTPGEAVGEQLSCAVTVTYPLLGVTIPAASAPVTVAPPPPTITDVSQSRRVWREGSKLAQISSRTHRSSRKKARKKAPPVGTTFSFETNEQVSVSFSFKRLLVGRTAARRCVAKTRRNAAHRRCERTVAAGTLSEAAESGENEVAFQGRISSGKRLAPGSYTLTIVATNSVGVRSAPNALSFTIAR